MLFSGYLQQVLPRKDTLAALNPLLRTPTWLKQLQRTLNSNQNEK